MDKSWMKLKNKFSVKYKGVFQFLEVAKYRINEYERTKIRIYFKYHEI